MMRLLLLNEKLQCDSFHVKDGLQLFNTSNYVHLVNWKSIFISLEFFGIVWYLLLQRDSVICILLILSFYMVAFNRLNGLDGAWCVRHEMFSRLYFVNYLYKSIWWYLSVGFGAIMRFLLLIIIWRLLFLILTVTFELAGERWWNFVQKLLCSGRNYLSLIVLFLCVII